MRVLVSTQRGMVEIPMGAGPLRFFFPIWSDTKIILNSISYLEKG